MSEQPSATYEPWKAYCSECGEEISNPDDRAWQEVTGWEKRRAQGGTNHVALRRPTGKFMCTHCMKKLQDGVGSGQLEISGNA